MSLISSFFDGRRSNNTNDPFSRVRDLIDKTQFSNETTQFAHTQIDWKETEESYVFKVDLSGIKREEVKVEVEEGNVLQISGKRSKEMEENKDNYHRVERSSASFVKQWELPGNAKVNQMKASTENGVLTVIVPKSN